MKKRICIVGLCVSLFLLMMFGIYRTQKNIIEPYDDSIALIEAGTYEEALDCIEKANPDKIERTNFDSEMRAGKLEVCYRNSAYLYAYALARLEYNSENKNMTNVNEYLELIPISYSGELSEEIKSFKENFKLQYEVYLEEKRKQDEEKRRIREQVEAERLKHSVPYVGMSESKINDTVLGSNYVIGHNYEMINGKKVKANIYRFKQGNSIIFVARCLRGSVDSVSDYRDDPWVTRSSSSSKSSSSKKKVEDEYNVNDYSDPEDFYDDNYDDFWDYDEAEDYYNRYHD